MNESFWQLDVDGQRYETVGKDYAVDVVVIGAGITGATAAYLCKRAGKSVALVERGLWGAADTGHTTAHLTCVTDTRLTELVRRFGRDHAAAVWDAGVAAMEHIEENVKHFGVDCGFRRVPGYLHASLTGANGDERAPFFVEAALGREMGFDVEYVEAVPGLRGVPGMRVANQGVMHPRKYVGELVRRIPGGGSHVFEQSEVTEVCRCGEQKGEASVMRAGAVGVGGKRFLVKVNGHVIECRDVVVATHVPMMGASGLIGGMLLQSTLAAYTTYAIGATVAKGTVPAANYWDTSDPYYYLRIAPGVEHDLVIFGGEDHKTGQEADTEGRYARLGAKLLELVPEVKVGIGWSGQVIATNDGLPVIGEIEPGIFVATGFGGNGMTFGTLGGMMAFDAITMRLNPWKELFDVKRTRVAGAAGPEGWAGAAWNYVKENLDYPFYMMKDRLTGEAGGAESVGIGEGKVVMEQGKRVAAYRDEAGKVVRLSPVCTHMGCIVHWNGAEKTWDCPCHGSRFKCTGEVVSGPAKEGLGKA